MTPIDQTIVDAGIGDCQRATTASLFNLDIDQVPNFRKYDKNWFDVYWYFLYALGYEYTGQRDPQKNTLDEDDSVGGYFDGCVESKTFPGCTHSVVVDMQGVVVHDPNPNKRWQGINILESGELKSWYGIKRREE